MSVRSTVRPRHTSTKLVYRVVAHNPPQAADFLSDAALGKRMAAWESEDDHRGISVWAAVRQARYQARFLKRGDSSQWHYIVEIPVEQGGPLRTWRSGPMPGHYTLRGHPETIRQLARVVERV